MAIQTLPTILASALWLTGVMHLAAGAWVRLRSPGHPAARAHWQFCLIAGLALLAIGDNLTGRYFGGGLTAMLIALVGSGAMALAMQYPRPWPLLRQWPWLPAANRILGLAMAATLALVSLWPVGSWVQSSGMILTAIGCLPIPLAAIWTWWSATSSWRERSQAAIILLGTVAAVLVSLGLMLGGPLWPISLVRPAWPLLVIGFVPLAVSYAIMRRLLFDVRAFVGRALQGFLSLGGLAIVYFGIYALADALFFPERDLRMFRQIPGLLGALAVAATYRPITRRSSVWIERCFGMGRPDALAFLAQLSQVPPGEPGKVGEEILSLIEQTFDPQWGWLQVGSEVLACRGKPPVILDQALQAPAARPLGPLHELVATADELAMYLRIPASDGHEGILCLGPGPHGRPYDRAQRALLRVAIRQAGIALQNARLFIRRQDLLVQQSLTASLAETRHQVLMQILHDLGSDLFNIMVATERLKQDPRTDGPRQSLFRSLDRLERFLAEKTDITRSERLAATDLVGGVQAAAEQVSVQAEIKEQRLRIELPEAPLTVPLTAIELEQVVVNLLDNACKFAPAGTTILVVGWASGSTVTLSVSDEGPGIPDQLVEQLGSGARGTPEVPGSGLGLRNVSTLVEAAGGSVSWRNNPKGASVEIHLPVVDPPDSNRLHVTP